jgi:hypothetical protein
MTERIITPKRMTDVTDWSGVLLNKKVLKLLQPGCIVRVLADYSDNGIREPTTWGGEYMGSCSYYRIVKIKDGTLWGECLDYYRMDSDECYEKGNRVGDIFTFRFNNISEVPIDWQPKPIRKKMKQYRDRRNRGYAMTGYR